MNIFAQPGWSVKSAKINVARKFPLLQYIHGENKSHHKLLSSIWKHPYTWHDQGKWVTCQNFTTFSKLQNASFWCKLWWRAIYGGVPSKDCKQSHLVTNNLRLYSFKHLKNVKYKYFIIRDIFITGVFSILFGFKCIRWSFNILYKIYFLEHPYRAQKPPSFSIFVFIFSVNRCSAWAGKTSIGSSTWLT